MSKKLFFASALIALAVLFGACGKSGMDKSLTAVNNSAAAAPVNTAAVANDNSGAAEKKSGGQITVIAGVDKDVLKMRSTRFRWASCTKRVVDALRSQAGVKDVKVDVNAQPLTLTIRFDRQAVNADAIGETAKQALESDPDNTGPVSVIQKEEK